MGSIIVGYRYFNQSSDNYENNLKNAIKYFDLANSIIDGVPDDDNNNDLKIYKQIAMRYQAAARLRQYVLMQDTPNLEQAAIVSAPTFFREEVIPYLYKCFSDEFKKVDIDNLSSEIKDMAQLAKNNFLNSFTHRGGFIDQLAAPLEELTKLQLIFYINTFKVLGDEKRPRAISAMEEAVHYYSAKDAGLINGRQMPPTNAVSSNPNLLFSDATQSRSSSPSNSQQEITPEIQRQREEEQVRMMKPHNRPVYRRN